jgi:hypothetical protein
MRFARWVFSIAGIYGVVMVTPQYWLEDRLGQDYPPAITHPEYFYGFVGVTLAWQVAFLVIAQDPVRYRLFMLPAILEKASFGVASLVLYAQGRIPALLALFGIIDLALGVLFAEAFRRTRMG